MAKKLDAELAKTLKNLGINAKTEEEAHKKLVAALEKEGIEGMEDESLAALIDMADGFLNDSTEDEEESEPEEVESGEDTDEEMDELADEVENEAKETEEEESEPEEEDAEEVEEEPVKPTKKAAKEKTSTKKATEKPAKAKKTSSRGQKLDPKNNPEDRKVLSEIKELFGDDYGFDYVKSNGATVKHLGKNGKRGVVLIENLTQHNNGTVTGNLYLLTMVKQTNILDELNIDYDLCWTKAPVMKNITLEEIKQIIEQVFETITGAVVKIDKRLGDNRKKMEENLKKTEKKAAKKVAAKPTEEPEEIDDEVEDEEVNEAPAKPAKKNAKKATKKTK